MLCDNCKVDRLITDFINSKNICYKCMYRIKLQNMTEKRTLKTCFCRTCGDEIIQDHNAKKRQRTVFCSSLCAENGHKKQLNEHWTRKIQCDNYSEQQKKNKKPRKRGMKWTSNQTSTRLEIPSDLSTETLKSMESAA